MSIQVLLYNKPPPTLSGLKCKHLLLLMGLWVSWAVLLLAGLSHASAMGPAAVLPTLAEPSPVSRSCLAVGWPGRPQLEHLDSPPCALLCFNGLLWGYLCASTRVPRGRKSIRILEPNAQNWYTVTTATICWSKHFSNPGQIPRLMAETAKSHYKDIFLYPTRHWFSDFSMHQNLLHGLLKQIIRSAWVSDSVSLG